MSSKEEKSSDLSPGDAGKKFRLVVRSAEEAVRVIREKLGEDARFYQLDKSVAVA